LIAILHGFIAINPALVAIMRGLMTIVQGLRTAVRAEAGRRCYPFTITAYRTPGRGSKRKDVCPFPPIV
jgi:hypothetical protein